MYPRLPLTYAMVFIKLTSPKSNEENENYVHPVIPILRQGKWYAMFPKCNSGRVSGIPKSCYSKQKELYEQEGEKIS